MYRPRISTPLYGHFPIIRVLLALNIIISPFAYLLLYSSTYAQSATIPLVKPPLQVQVDTSRTGLSGLCIGCTLSNTQNTTDSDTNNYGLVNIPLGVGGSGTIAVQDTTATYSKGQFAGFVIGDEAGLGVQLLNIIRVTTYNNGTALESKTAIGLLDLPIVSGRHTIGFIASQDFDEISITIGGVASLVANVKVFYALVHTPDVTAPAITSVTSISQNGTYGLASAIPVTVNLSEPVVIGSYLVLTLNTGGSVTLTCVVSSCSSLSGIYTVLPTDANTADLTVTAVTGKLLDAAGNATLTPTIPSGNNLGDTADIAINSALPDVDAPVIRRITSLTPAGTYGLGANINITAELSERVGSDTTLQATLNTGDTITLVCDTPACTSLSGTLVVGVNDDVSALLVSSIAGTLTDLASNITANLGLPLGQNLDANVAIAINTSIADTVAPTISAITSTTPDGTYGVGSDINITVELSEAVVAPSSLRLVLNTSDTIILSCTTSPCSTLSGTYTVDANDNVPDLTVTAVTGTLVDAANNVNNDPIIPAGRNLGDLKQIVLGSPDTDQDGTPDASDSDDDNDGISDAVEGNGAIDTDNDGTPDSRDTDSDNDGVPDSVEGATTDTDGDGIPNYRDVDDDNDGVLTRGEDRDGDGNPANDDADNDGVPDYLDPDRVTDFDGDGIADAIDTDDDNDGIADTVEGDGVTDTDNDGTPDSRDTDSDNDSIPDSVEAVADPLPNSFSTGEMILPIDTDKDGIADFRDTDSDNDTLGDRIEGIGDIDGDGIRNYRDLDSDGDGVLDRDEGGSDADGDGVPDAADPDTIPKDFRSKVYVPIVKQAS